MEGIREWAFGICSAIIACGIAQMILPKSNMQKVFNITASVFFLGCLISPVAFGTLGIDAPDDTEIQKEVQRRAEQLEQAAHLQAQQYASVNLRAQIKQTLAEIDVTAEKIYVNVHDVADYGISISECELELNQSYFPRHDEIRAKLKEKLGIEVQIGYTKE